MTNISIYIIINAYYLYMNRVIAMRISARGRYALAAVVEMARVYGSGDFVTAAYISEKLGLSKIYLEQVFTLLKKADLVISSKGAQGGYMLICEPENITALQVLAAVEGSLFEQTQKTTDDNAPEIEQALEHCIYRELDKNIREALGSVTVADLLKETVSHAENCTSMYYI